jgi:hypothetical protein
MIFSSFEWWMLKLYTFVQVRYGTLTVTLSDIRLAHSISTYPISDLANIKGSVSRESRGVKSGINREVDVSAGSFL